MKSRLNHESGKRTYPSYLAAAARERGENFFLNPHRLEGGAVLLLECPIGMGRRGALCFSP